VTQTKQANYDKDFEIIIITMSEVLKTPIPQSIIKEPKTQPQNSEENSEGGKSQNSAMHSDTFRTGKTDSGQRYWCVV